MIEFLKLHPLPSLFKIVDSIILQVRLNSDGLVGFQNLKNWANIYLKLLCDATNPPPRPTEKPLFPADNERKNPLSSVKLKKTYLPEQQEKVQH